MRVRAAVFLALLVGLAGANAAAAEPALPPPPTRHVTDGAGFLGPDTALALDGRLADYEKQTGHQILVWIGDTLGDQPLDDWSVRTFAAWKVGRKGKDDGLVLFILAKDRKIDIEVGYGLEGVVPDARAKQVISDTMAPLLREGKNDQAVTAAVDRLLESIEGKAVTGPDAGVSAVGGQPTAVDRPPPAPLSVGRLIFYGVIGLLLLVFVITNPRLAMFFLFNILSGGRGGGFGGFGGGGGGGGGWSGGGGSSGGGGARGSW